LSQLILILGIAGLVWLYFLYRRKGKAQEKVTAEMVKCETCSVNIPKSVALESGGKWFCSEEHKN